MAVAEGSCCVMPSGQSSATTSIGASLPVQSTVCMPRVRAATAERLSARRARLAAASSSSCRALASAAAFLASSRFLRATNSFSQLRAARSWYAAGPRYWGREPLVTPCLYASCMVLAAITATASALCCLSLADPSSAPSNSFMRASPCSMNCSRMKHCRYPRRAPAFSGENQALLRNPLYCCAPLNSGVSTASAFRPRCGRNDEKNSMKHSMNSPQSQLLSCVGSCRIFKPLQVVRLMTGAGSSGCSFRHTRGNRSSGPSSISRFHSLVRYAVSCFTMGAVA
mmetsp:Transcript_18208/g.54716  ORF Transcript_18208/g.54716 Transcript_18208/m.54716 type:complete len:283 (+) Transcript_18208:2391-3239(+)